MPEYTKAYAGTAKWLTKSSEVLNNATPKFWVKDYPEPDKYTPGAININPAIVEHLLDSYLGGLYTFPSKAAKTVSMIWDEDMQDIHLDDADALKIQSMIAHEGGINKGQPYQGNRE